MAYETYLHFALALLLVLGLIAILAWVLRRFGFGGALRGDNRRRVQIIETTPLGPRHRLILIRRDQTEHLLLLGSEGDLVVERGIERAIFKQEMTRPTPSRVAEAREIARQDPPSLRPIAEPHPQENHES